MMNKNILNVIGNTPLVEVKRITKNDNIKANIFAKLESFNPSGSIKDRVSLAMIEDAEEKKILNKDSVIIEPTSGNTGIGLALITAAKGYRLILTMPESMSIERRKILEAYGAELILTPASEGMKGAIAQAKVLQQQITNSYIPSQFDNVSNPLIHYRTTGPEIWNDCNGKVDVLIAGVGTGGTISGTGKFLKEKNPNIWVIAVEPFESSVLSGSTPSPHKIQGIGAGFIPQNYNAKYVDEIITIKSEDALSMGNKLAKIEGLFVGISSGAAFKAATIVACRPEYKNKNIVVIMPDSGTRYLSTTMYQNINE